MNLSVSIFVSIFFTFRCNLEADTVLDLIQNDPNYGNINLSSKQLNDYAQRLALKASNAKTFLKKYEDLKTRKYVFYSRHLA